MKIDVRVYARSSRHKVDVALDGTLIVRVTEPAEGGRANAAAIKMLAKHFHVLQRDIAIVRGHASRNKLLEITAPIGRQRAS